MMGGEVDGEDLAVLAVRVVASLVVLLAAIGLVIVH
jgi:hypothetical protein